jgi:hypothetical protein
MVVVVSGGRAGARYARRGSTGSRTDDGDEEYRRISDETKVVDKVLRMKNA